MEKNLTIEATTSPQGRVSIYYPTFLTNKITLRVINTKYLMNDAIIDENSIRGKSLLNDSVSCNIKFDSEKEYKTGDSIGLHLLIRSLTATIWLKELQIQALITESNGAITAIGPIIEWPGSLQPGQVVEGLLNLITIPKKMALGNYILLLQLRCGEKTLTSGTKTIRVRQVFTLTVRTRDERGNAIAGAEVLLKMAMEGENLTFEVARTKTNPQGLASFEVEKGTYLIEVLMNSQKTFEQEIKFENDYTLTATLHKPTTTGQNNGKNPQLIMAAIVSILSSIMILAVRRKQKRG